MGDTEYDERLSIAVRTLADMEQLDADERLLVAEWLSELTLPTSLPPPAQRRRRNVLAVATASTLFLVPWTIYLAATLPQRHRAHAWDVAWVGFDIALAAAFAATTWYGWRGRQLVITALLVTSTLLLCDAWFDITLSWGGSEQATSIFTAAVAEVPLASFLLFIYHRIIKTLTAQAWRDRGRPGRPPPLRRVQLLLRPEHVHGVPLEHHVSRSDRG